MTERSGPDPLVRLSVVGIVCISLFAALFARLWYLQVIDKADYQLQASAIHTRPIHEEGPRGRILDRNGRVLVDNRISLVVGIDRQPLRHRSQSARQAVFEHLALTLTNTFGLPTKAATISRSYDDKRYGPQDLVPVASDVSESVELYLAEHAEEYPGVVVRRQTVRVYPYGALAAQIVGYVGQINSTELAAAEKKYGTPAAPITRPGVISKPYATGDEIGKAGVEATYESDLRGTPGDRTIQVDARGDFLATLKESNARPGDDIWLSIDINLQKLAEDQLTAKLAGIKGTVTKDGKVINAPQGSVVITDPKTGQILAMASEPSYNPADLVNGISTAEWDYLNSKDQGQPLFNWALQGQYAPGSTFKLVTATAALKTGFLHPGNDHYNDTGTYKVGNCRGTKCTFSNDQGERNGTIELTQAITVSSDVFFYWIGDQLWQQRGALGLTPIQDAGKLYGLGAPTGVALPGEAGGRLPTPDLLARQHAANPTAFPRGQWLAGDNLNTALGQGDDLVTPLQLANAYATFANGGTRFVPLIVTKVTRPHDVSLPTTDPASSTLVRQVQPQQVDQVGLSAAQYAQMLAGFQGVVQSGRGTAHGAWVASRMSPAWPVAGKTGTAQVTGKAASSVFAAFGPVDGVNVPGYSIAIIIPEAGYGADVAAPVAFTILKAISENAVPVAAPVPAAAPADPGLAAPAATAPTTVAPAGPTTTTAGH